MSETDTSLPAQESPYDDLTDEDVILRCHEGDERAMEHMLNRYKNFVRSKARSYFLVGADHEDIVQEGMIGLYKAIRDFRPDKQSAFHAFNSAISLNKPLYDDESDRTLLDVIVEGKVSNPEDLLISQEDMARISSKMDEELSPLERDVLESYLDGKSYVRIAAELHRHVKSVDNALQRVKRKLGHYLREQQQEQ